ncbi:MULTISPECIES: right-handed parallel beta-helix repeat-containing protein [Deinococcus]|uniref:Right-handed parallel beta-helix repeat-containing protein n=1 Tax=Deinococcus rufus TaxID=2136097 RepID=A0ABV7Z6N2_9DEIO|nr:right-handed parallel beta-helix repeat-containing protein [Deinococcus sp. AB2017081]WQE94441.1 right-handed parallel beta-helix repeat-containing protein [Deinococcus sp. AB2017081]
MTNLDYSKFTKKLYTALTNTSNNGKLLKVNTTTGSPDFIDVPSGGGGGTTSVTGGNFPILNLPATVSAATVTTTLNNLAGQTVIVDKMYTVDGGVTVPADTILLAMYEGCGFKLTGATNSLLFLSGGAVINGLTLDGNRGNLTGTYGFGFALARLISNSTKLVQIIDCTLKNYGAGAIYGKNINGLYAFNNRIDGVYREAIMTQRSQNVWFENNKITNGPATAQFHGKDSEVPTAISKMFRCINNVWDFSNITLDANETILFIETWGGVEDVVIHGNRMLAPNTNNSNTVFGISLDYTKYATVSSNYIDGGDAKILGYGLEAAGSEDCTYTDNTVNGYKGLAISISRSETRNIKVINNLIQNGTSSGWGCQVIDGAQDVLFQGNTFRDFGDYGIRFNGTGSGSQILNNRFYIRSQNFTGVGIFNQGAKRLVVRDNIAGPEFRPGVTAGTGYLNRFYNSDSGTYCTISSNNVSCQVPSTLATGASSVAIMNYGSTGGNVIENNVIQYSGIGIQTETSTTQPGNRIVANRSFGNVTTLVNSQNSNDKKIDYLA